MLIPASRLLRCARRGRVLVPDDAKGAGLRGLGGAKGGLVDTGRACHYGMFHTDFQVAGSLTRAWHKARGRWHGGHQRYLDNSRVSLERRSRPGRPGACWVQASRQCPSVPRAMLGLCQWALQTMRPKLRLRLPILASGACQAGSEWALYSAD
jgi:hypothetical protein